MVKLYQNMNAKHTLAVKLPMPGCAQVILRNKLFFAMQQYTHQVVHSVSSALVDAFRPLPRDSANSRELNGGPSCSWCSCTVKGSALSENN